VDWSGVDLWAFHRVGHFWAIKINPTAVETSVKESHGDKDVRVDLHVTGNDRLIGYTLWGRKIGAKPMCLLRPFYLGLFYTNLRDIDPQNIRKPIEVLYHDYNVRLLAFGAERDPRDYLMVLRAKPQETK